MTQCADLLNLLQQGPVTTLEAITKIGCLRCSERVRELEDMGFRIKHEIVERKNRKGKACRVARYTLIGVNHKAGIPPVLRERA